MYICIYECIYKRYSGILRPLKIVSPQMTLTADELFLHKICVTYGIEMILGSRTNPWDFSKNTHKHFSELYGNST